MNNSKGYFGHSLEEIKNLTMDVPMYSSGTILQNDLIRANSTYSSGQLYSNLVEELEVLKKENLKLKEILNKHFPEEFI